MSHINIGSPTGSACARKMVKLEDFTGGVRFCDFSRELLSGQSPYMKNLIYRDNLLRTRMGQEALDMGDIAFSGEFHSKNTDSFFGCFILHIGSELIRFSESGISVIYSDIPDCDSFVFEMNARLYFFCRCARVFVVEKDMTVSEYTPPVRTIYTDANYKFTSYTECPVEDNILAFGSVRVTYTEQRDTPYIVLPTRCDTDYPIIIKYLGTDQVMPAESYTVEEDRIVFERTLYSGFDVVYMPAKGERFRGFDKIFDCRTTVCYGGTGSTGTRVFFSGNSELPGYYFYSELLEPLVVRELSFDIIGNGNQEITRLAKQKDDLIVFCDRSVYRISYSFGSSTGPDFSASQISAKVGCDMPGSVALIDNRLVFANGAGGVYIIVSSDYTDELSVRSISGNINVTEAGLLSCTPSALAGCHSVDYGRCYYLCVGDKCYVWDYGATPYVVSTDPARSEKILSWYYFDGICEKCFFELSGTLYGTYEKGAFRGFSRLSEDIFTDFGVPIVCELTTGEYDLSSPMAKKRIREVYTSVLENAGAEITLFAMSDGEEIRSELFKLSGGAGKLARLYMKVPFCEKYRFSVKIKSAEGILGVSDIVLSFCDDKILYR